MSTEVIITANLPSDDTPNVHCTPTTARAGLVTLLAHHPDWIGLQEFGIKPTGEGYHFTTLHPCVGAKKSPGDKFHQDRVLLAKGRTVEPEAGRRTHLPDVYATILERTNEATGYVGFTSNTHLPAHVEMKGLYRKVRDQLTGRSAMHRQARRAWRRDAHARARHLKRQHRGKQVHAFLTADPNFELMRLKGFVSCWVGHRALHTFGPRTIDAVWAERPAITVQTVKIPSDHHAVKATYRS